MGQLAPEFEMLRPRAAVFIWVLATAALAGCGQEETETEQHIVRPVKALKVADPSILEGRWFSGRAQSVNQVDLSFRVPGTLIDIAVKVGDILKENAVVARLDPATYQTEVDRLEAEVAQAKASYENSRLQLARQEELFRKDVASEARVDRQRAQALQDAARIKAMEAALKKAELELEYTALRAPFDGTVVATYVENFEDIRAKEPILRLLDPSQIEMIINIPETLITLISQVTNIEVAFDALPDLKIPATVKEIGSEASLTTRTYPVTLIMDLPDGASILPGMAGKATGRAERQNGSTSGVIIPPASLFDEDGRSMVWVIDAEQMTVSKRNVQIGPPVRTGIRVEEGLQAKEWIVTAGVNSLKEGQKVRFLEGK